ncbi:MAG TPA: DUF2182 domain-containing protein [Candidatus Sulfomarinibacteraceae bacterium]|nr:DUF2182 domain-containing protein [Candidatus Sulfomarinibacteraceae bacterium]
MLRHATRDDTFATPLVALIAAGWLLLAIWSASPYAPYLNHEILEHLPFTLSLDYALLMLIFIAGWALMIVAMMLPGSLSQVAQVRRRLGRRPGSARPVVLFVGGYVALWTVLGGLAHFGDLFVHEATHRFSWLGANTWLIAAATLAVAGLYQFTPLKRACRQKCGLPAPELNRRTPGGASWARSLWLGVRHGVYCAGTCWPLMLLMFAFACGNVLWMLGLGAVMAAEKNASWGRRMTAPLGILLLGAAVAVTLVAPFVA